MAAIFVLCLLQEQHKMSTVVFSIKIREGFHVVIKYSLWLWFALIKYKTNHLLSRRVSHTLGKISLKLHHCRILKVREHDHVQHFFLKVITKSRKSTSYQPTPQNKMKNHILINPITTPSPHSLQEGVICLFFGSHCKNATWHQFCT